MQNGAVISIRAGGRRLTSMTLPASGMTRAAWLVPTADDPVRIAGSDRPRASVGLSLTSPCWTARWWPVGDQTSRRDSRPIFVAPGRQERRKALLDRCPQGCRRLHLADRVVQRSGRAVLEKEGLTFLRDGHRPRSRDPVRHYGWNAREELPGPITGRGLDKRATEATARHGPARTDRYGRRAGRRAAAPLPAGRRS